MPGHLDDSRAHRFAPRFAAALQTFLAAGSLLLATTDVHATCDVIPGTQQSFPSTLATADRPFAQPGDWVRLSRDPICHAASPGFVPPASNQVVTLVFDAASGPSHVVVLATNCAALEARRQICEARADVATATCVTANAGGQPLDLVVPDPDHLRFRFPDTDALFATCAGGASPEAPCLRDADCGGGTCTTGQSDDRTLAGPVAFAVTDATAALPCALASAACGGLPDLLACVDVFFRPTGDDCTAVPHDVFAGFTALPPPNDFQALCTAPSPPCTGTSDELRLATDADGNLLVPVDMRGVLVNRDDVPIARLLRGATLAEAFATTGQPIQIPDDGYVASFTVSGARLPPIFEPQADPGAGDSITLFGTADAPASVLRIARRSPTILTCVGGDADGIPCAAADDCPNGTCGAFVCAGGGAATALCATGGDCPAGFCREGLFELRDRRLGDVGPVVLRLGACLGGATPLAACSVDAECPLGQCGDFMLAALDPVPLDGLAQTAVANVFVLSEAIQNQDLDGDGDAVDDVIRLGDRQTGVVYATGPGGAPGRAITRVREAPFSFPAVAVAHDLVAYLEPEMRQGALDQNGDGDVADTLLRVFRIAVEGAAEVGVAGRREVDAAGALDGRSLTVSNGRVFARVAEAGGADTTTALVSSTNGGTIGNGQSRLAVVSANGRFVAFDSIATNLVPGDTNARRDVFVKNLATGTVERASVSAAGVQADADCEQPAISADGRFVAFHSRATNLGAGLNGLNQVFVRDRLTGTTELVSRSTAGATGDRATSSELAISGDGRFVAFASEARNLVPEDVGIDDAIVDIFLRDRAAGTTERVSRGMGDAHPNNNSQQPAVSDDGRHVAFVSVASNLVPGDPSLNDVFVYDRADTVTERITVDARGNPANHQSAQAAISADGRFVAFSSLASNLVAGDTNGLRDVFVRDRTAGVTERASVDVNGGQANGESVGAALSRDGRFAAFTSTATNLAAGDGNGRGDAFVRDRLTGILTRVSVSETDAEADDETPAVAVANGGRVAVFGSLAGNLVAGDGNAAQDVFVRTADPLDVASDVTGDGALDDVVLQVVDGASGAVAGPRCPADAVAVADGAAAFLRPEASGAAAGCPNPAPSLNGDADQVDRVVHLWSDGSVQNLGRAATAVALSASRVGALVSEAGSQTVLNGDGDTGDDVVHVWARPAGPWVNLGQAATSLALAGTLVAFVTPESAQAAGSLNADADVADRVLQVFDAAAFTPLLGAGTTPRTVAGEGIVTGGAPGAELVAFRTSEAAEGSTDLNGDGDTDDDVLQVYDRATASLVNSGAAVRPCRLEACDPRVPYRVGADTVRFLTLEADQSADLNGDGDELDLVLQVFNVRQAAGDGAGLAAGGRAARTSAQSAAAPLHALAAVSAGVCTTSAEACVDDAECGAGTCFVPPGGCTRTLGGACNPELAGACGAGNFCDPTPGAPGAGVCKRVEGPCVNDAGCAAPAVCVNTGSNFQRLAAPLATDPDAGVAVVSGGRCLEPRALACGADEDCPPGDLCEGGTCRRDHGTCRTDDDCPATASCRRELVLAAAADVDGDELPDPIDNCPNAANVTQDDHDLDGVGDACEAPPTPTATPPATRTPTPTPTATPGENACAAVPRGDCRRPVVSGRASVQIKDGPGTDKDALVWKWIAGETTPKSDFGSPLASTAYDLCLYAGDDLVTAATMPAGGLCDGKPCWKEQSTGFSFRARASAPRSSLALKLREGLTPGSAKIMLKASGAAAPPPDLSALEAPLAVQLVAGGGTCWEAVYSPPFLSRSAVQLRDRAD